MTDGEYRMKIALDYDLTYSLDPDFWQWFARGADNFGHEIRIVTIRDDRFDRTQAMIDVERYFKVVYTRGVAKKWYMSHFGDGFIPDVWVDDRPETILSNSATTVEGLAEWREKRAEGPSIPLV